MPRGDNSIATSVALPDKLVEVADPLEVDLVDYSITEDTQINYTRRRWPRKNKSSSGASSERPCGDARLIPDEAVATGMARMRCSSRVSKSTTYLS